MIKKSVTFENFDGDTVTKEYHFHLNKAELAQLELSAEGGLSAKLRGILETKDGSLIVETFKNLLLQTVGRRQGELFLKTQEVRDEFEYSGAYSAMFMDMILNPDEAVEFMKGIVPKDVADKADFSELTTEVVTTGVARPQPKAIEDMSVEELKAALAGRTEL